MHFLLCALKPKCSVSLLLCFFLLYEQFHISLLFSLVTTKVIFSQPHYFYTETWLPAHAFPSQVLLEV